ATATAIAVMRASAVTAATSATPRSRRRDTHDLHELARRTACGMDPDADLAQRRRRGPLDVPLEREPGPRAGDSSRLRRSQLGLREEGPRRQPRPRELGVVAATGDAPCHEALERDHADREHDQRDEHLEEPDAARTPHGAATICGAIAGPVTAIRRASLPSTAPGRRRIALRSRSGAPWPGASVSRRSRPLSAALVASATVPPPLASRSRPRIASPP